MSEVIEATSTTICSAKITPSDMGGPGRLGSRPASAIERAVSCRSSVKDEAMAPSNSSHAPNEAGAISRAITVRTLPVGPTKPPSKRSGSIGCTGRQVHPSTSAAITTTAA